MPKLTPLLIVIEAAVTVSLVPEAKNGPFVFGAGVSAACAMAARLGFSAIELFPRSAEEVNADALKRALSRDHLKLAGVGTGAGWLVRKLSLTSPDSQIRKNAEIFIGNIIDLAARFGAPAVIGSMQGRLEDVRDREKALKLLTKALERLGQRAGAAGTNLLIEPLNRYETNVFNRVSDVLTLIRSLKTKNVKVLCDLFHMNIEEKSIPAALISAGNHVGHVHWADSNRQAMGFGHTSVPPIAKALRQIGYNGFVSAEIFPLPNPKAAAKQTIKSYRMAFPRS